MDSSLKESGLNAALRQFELAEANLIKLERLWSQIESLTPEGIVFEESKEMENYIRSYGRILEYLPLIDNNKPTAIPMEIYDIAQCRMDANDVGEIDAHISVEKAISAPGRELREYRYHFDRSRQKLVRNALEGTISSIDSCLRELKSSPDYSNASGIKIESDAWKSLVDHFKSLFMLVGKDLPSKTRWFDLKRHIHFGQTNDLRDIIESDWPSVKSGLEYWTSTDDEPLMLQVKDLSDLVESKPSGVVATRLNWTDLSEENFERLIFSILSSESTYENPEWLMHTNAPDRGRDIAAYRVFADPLAGSIRSRVIIQCKHWTSKSINVPDISSLRDQMRLWEPPCVDVHVIATSGRFTSDAVSFVEKHNQSDTSLRIEMWPESHLELILAARPELIAMFHLR